MDLHSIENVMREHFISFGNLSQEEKNTSIIQSSRLSLSMLKYHLLSNIKVGEENKEDIKSIFHIFDSSLRYLLDGDCFYHHDTSDEESREVCSSCGGIEKKSTDNHPTINPLRKEDILAKAHEGIESENFTDKNTEDSDWASSLNNEGADNNDAVVEEENKDWPEEEKDCTNFFIVYSEEISTTIYNDIIRNKLGDSYLKLLNDLLVRNIMVVAPYKLNSYMEHHKTIFECMNEVERNCLYAVPLKQGCRDLLEEYFKFD